jgi:class 3 adenylate cyclase
MAKISLKNIILKNKEINHIISAMLSKTSAWIEDERGTILMGERKERLTTEDNLILDGELLGVVRGDQEAMISTTISYFVQKEAEKKKLGSEVLNLYQELNVIYNFSEQLTQTIEPDVIAQLTLEQAIHSIPSESGVILLWDETHKQLTIPAYAGQPLFDQDKIKKNVALLLNIGMNGQSEIIGDISVLVTHGIIQAKVQSIIYAAMKVKHRIMGAIILAGLKPEQYSAAHLKLLVTLALQSSTAIESAMLFEKNIREVKEREEAILRIHEVTKKFVPIEFIRALGKESLLDVKLGDQVGKTVTVLFTDIRDFTPLSEKMTPEENFRFVSSFNERLGPIIRAHRGFINQYLGDSIMALFPTEPEDALQAAIEMQAAIQKFNRDRIAEGLSPIKAGIGLHTGPLIMGITGDEHRLDAATISDTVNSASRIESLTKHYQSPLLLSGDTLNSIREYDKYQLRHLGKVQLKGKNNILNIIECIDGYADDELAIKLQTLPDFNKAMTHYSNHNFMQAAKLFEHIIAMDPHDYAAKYFLNSALKLIHTGVPMDWKGAEVMSNK